MTTLTDLGLHYGTDKATVHRYTDYYEKLFKGWRSKPVKILEIGVAGGESIKMWAEFFYNKESRIYGVEIENRPLPEFDDRTQIFITDATSPNAVYDITNATGQLDVVLDDGSHYVRHQKSSLDLWWPHIKPGGYFICEDNHSNWHYPWWDGSEEKFVHSLNPWINRVNENGKDQCAVPTDGDVEEIVFRKSLLVIKKR